MTDAVTSGIVIGVGDDREASQLVDDHGRGGVGMAVPSHVASRLVGSIQRSINPRDACSVRASLFKKVETLSTTFWTNMVAC